MIIERNALKERLQQIADNDYEWPEDDNAKNYLESLCHYIGDTDPVLRDDLVYPILGDLVQNETLMPAEEAASLLMTLVGENYLGHGLGLELDDSVFKRTFSALIIACLIDRDVENPYLTDEQRHTAGTCLLHAFIAEQDIRNYVPEKGWAHSLAHYSDAIGCLLNHDSMAEQFLHPVMVALATKLSAKQGVWSGAEDERWVTALATPLFANQFLPETTVLDWFGQMGSALENVKGPSRNEISINNRQFLRSLYFRGLKHFPEHPFLEPLLQAQEQVNPHISYI